MVAGEMNMFLPNNPTAIITGGSKGVGMEICKSLLAEDYNVINLSRSSSGIFSDRFLEIKCDFSNKDSIINAADEIVKLAINPLWLIFNAAKAVYGKTFEITQDAVNKMVAVNFLNPILFLKYLKPRAGTKIIYVSTSASRIPAPKWAYYASTKLAFESMLQSMSMEYGYKVQIARPAEINTDFATVSGSPVRENDNRKKLLPKQVAKCVVKRINSRKTFINIGFRAKLIDIVVRTIPQLLLKRTISNE